MTTQERISIIQLEENSRENQERWNGYLQHCPDSNFYQQYEWKAVNEKEFGHRTYFLAASDGDSLCGVFPLVLLQSRLFGRILCSMPFVNFGGPSADNAAIEGALVEQACDIARREHADYLEIRSLHVCNAGLPTSEHKISMTLQLASDPDALWQAFKTKHRTNIRRVYKDEVRVESGHAELLDTFYEIMCRSWRSLGTPIYRKRYFRSILDAFGSQIRIFVAYHRDLPVATAFNGHFKGSVEGMWAGALPEARSLQVNYVLYWEMIKDACLRGFSSYHLGRSSVESGSESFKKKWNAETSQLYWQYFIPTGGDLPGLNKDNPKYRAAINAWQRLPLAVTRAIGPLLSKSIP